MMKTKGKVTIGALVGVITGALAGILFAPKSGKETRQDIKNVTLKAVDKLHAESDELIAKAKEMQSKLTDTSKQELTKIKTRVADTRSRLETAVSEKKNDKDLKEALSEAKDAVDHLKKFLKNVR